MSLPPVRQAFRRQVHEQALEAAHAMLLDKGWDQLRFGDVATAVGVSRPTLYAAFGNKEGLAEALVLRETDRFLTGIAQVLDAHDDDPVEAVTAAVAYTLREADGSPLLHAVLTSTRGGSDSLLPLLTTRSAPVLEAATAVLVGWFSEHVPGLDEAALREGVDALVRLVVSHLVLPAAEADQTPERLARLAMSYLQLASAVRP
ncbi:MAG: putative transcriptional regulator, TetR family [Frankiales bacterium]|jgi:AcrR family transcriptional regulator|nr:putative transcriptional regulator, TetR family [Frankiales bacterium]